MQCDENEKKILRNEKKNKIYLKKWKFWESINKHCKLHVAKTITINKKVINKGEKIDIKIILVSRRAKKPVKERISKWEYLIHEVEEGNERKFEREKAVLFSKKHTKWFCNFVFSVAHKRKKV